MLATYTEQRETLDVVVKAISLADLENALKKVKEAGIVNPCLEMEVIKQLICGAIVLKELSSSTQLSMF